MKLEEAASRSRKEMLRQKDRRRRQQLNRANVARTRATSDVEQQASDIKNQEDANSAKQAAQAALDKSNRKPLNRSAALDMVRSQTRDFSDEQRQKALKLIDKYT